MAEFKYHRELTGSELHPPGLISAPKDKQLLSYEGGVWVNKNLTDILVYYSVKNEVPTKLSERIFTTANKFLAGSLEVYLNGIKERYVVEDTDQQFSFLADTVTDDYVEVSYTRQPIT